MTGFMDILIAGMAAAAIGCLAWAVLNAFAGLKTEAKPETEFIHRLPPLLRFFQSLSLFWRGFCRGRSLEERRAAVEVKLWMAGYAESISAAEFLAAAFTAWTLAAALCLALLLAGWALPGLLCLLLGLYPAWWLRGIIRRRHLSILKALPNVLDLLTLSVEAGKDFMSSLRDILARRELDPLGEELERGLREIQLGSKRALALRNIAERVRQDELTTILNAVVQAEELGVSIGQMLRIQGDALRAKRFLRAEKLAGEAPVKMLLPLFLFIFPAVILILFVAIASEIAYLL